MQRISQHISFSEGIVSTTGLRLGIPNNPPAAVLANMRITAEAIFEPLRQHFGTPIRVLSFYRSPALNRAVDGSQTSQHMTGEAIDMQGTGEVSNADLFNYIKDNLPFDQLIWEFGNSREPAWVHVSYSKRPRKSILRASRVNGKTTYTKF